MTHNYDKIFQELRLNSDIQITRYLSGFGYEGRRYQRMYGKYVRDPDAGKMTWSRIRDQANYLEADK